MARPESWTDLPKHEQRGDEIARWSSYNLMSNLSVAKHLIAAAEAAQKVGLVVDNDGIYERPSPETMEERLQKAQRRWDALEEKYNVAAEFPGEGSSDLWEINNWASENGLPRIEKSRV